MKIAMNIIAVLLCLVGGIWFLQGINVLPGSFMSGTMFWAVVGAIMIVGGLLLLYRNVIRRRT